MSGHRTMRAAVPALALLTLWPVCGCGPQPAAGAGHTPPTRTTETGPPVARCGTSHTAAGVPVEIEVETGTVTCATALAVERDYTRALANGKVAGNGGGAPVTVRGWICQGLSTPKLLATGRASACRHGTAEIIAVLPDPAATTTPAR